MVFSSFTFVFLFLPVFLIAYFLSPKKSRNLTLLLFSYIFYAWGAPEVVWILLLSSTTDFFLSKYFSRAENKYKKHSFILSILLNVGLLTYFKYANFFVAETNKLLAVLGIDNLHWTEIALPIGISFFTFQKISYLVDVYRKDVEPSSTLANYLLYVVSFPQLIAGPIVRYRDVNKQIESRVHTTELAFEGAERFFIGLAKKVIIADQMGAVAENVFSIPMEQLSTGYAWLGIICYAYQIYFDFSAYSDMAIGLGLVMGFRFLENFNHPYIALNFTEFWRRWHISLSRWMRDYLYIPLGGNKSGGIKTYFNLWIVFLLSGLWHGASVSFILWGAYHGLFLTLDKLFWGKFSKKLWPVINIGITFILVCVGWVFFRLEDAELCFSYLARMFNPLSYWSVASETVPAFIIHQLGIVIFVIATILSFAPAFKSKINLKINFPDIVCDFTKFATCLFLLLLTVLMQATSDFAPFIYFRF